MQKHSIAYDNLHNLIYVYSPIIENDKESHVCQALLYTRYAGATHSGRLLLVRMYILTSQVMMHMAPKQLLQNRW